MAELLLARAMASTNIAAPPEKVFDAWLSEDVASRFVAAGNHEVSAISSDPLDGGSVNVPNVPFFDASGYLVEGEGVVPDVAVERDPAVAEDAQLAAAVAQLLGAIAEAPYTPPAKPPGGWV